MTLNNQPTN